MCRLLSAKRATMLRLSRCALFAVMLIAGAGSVSAAIVNENFEGYLPTPFVVEDGSGTQFANKGTGFSGAWNVLTSQRPNVNVTAKSMSYSGDEFTIVGGASALQIGQGVAGGTYDHVAIRSFNKQDSGDVWFSYMLETKPGTADTERDFFQILFDDATTSGDSYTVSSVLDGGSGGHNFRARVGGSANTTASSVYNVPGTTNFIVGRIIENGSGDYDTIEIYANPTSVTQPTTPSATATDSLSIPVTSIDSVRFRTSVWETTDELYFDEFRLGNSYQDILARYENTIRQEAPVFYARFNEASGNTVHDTMSGLAGTRIGSADLSATGLRTGGLESNNSAAAFDGNGDYISFADPGANSLLDFGGGDPITLEAWIQPDELPTGQFGTIISKGRNTDSSLQNYALRLRRIDSTTAEVGFIYRNAANTNWHIWDSNETISLGDDQWYHVALTYEFGDGGSMRVFVDGEELTGAWYAGYGPGNDAPYQSDQPLWIGSQQMASANATFTGRIDEAAIYGRILTPDEILAHYKAVVPEPSALLLLCLGTLGLICRRRRR